MPVVVVSASGPRAGATTVAAGLAHRLAYAGSAVRLVRAGDGAGAEADARAFAGLDFVESSGTPVAASAIEPGDGVTVVDASSMADAAALAARLNATHVLVSAGGAEAVSTGGLVIVNHAKRAAPQRLPEDR